MRKLLIKGGRVIDPTQNLDFQQDVMIEGGYIRQLGQNLPTQEIDDVIELKPYQWVCPGLIDMHVHLRDLGQTHKETIQSGAEAAIVGGFTRLATMPNTKPTIDNLKVLKQVQQIALNTARIPVDVIAAATQGLQGQVMTDITSLKQAGAIAFSDDGNCVMNAKVMRHILELCAQNNMVFMCHAEDTNLAHQGVMNEGSVSACLGLHGMPNVAESVIVARDIELARLTGAHVHFCHISALESIHLIRAAKQEGLKITTEVTPHHLALCDTEVLDKPFDSSTKMNPPLRRESDRQVLLQALADGTIDAVATDHAPHAEGEKRLGYGECPFGVVGLETAVGVTLKETVHAGLITPLKFVEVMSTNPAKLLGLPLGTLKVGSQADITIIDPELNWQVDSNQFKSKSRNTPFNGWQLKGNAVATISNGVVLYQHASLNQNQLMAVSFD